MPVKKAAKPDIEEPSKKSTPSKPAPGLMPKDPDLDEEELGEEDLEMAGEGEMEEDMEEDLALDDDEEDVDYLEKSEDLLDDSDDYRH
jgi:hypothetical protein